MRLIFILGDVLENVNSTIGNTFIQNGTDSYRREESPGSINDLERKDTTPCGLVSIHKLKHLCTMGNQFSISLNYAFNHVIHLLHNL